jgi:cyanophycinase-like exopeptidase
MSQKFQIVTSAGGPKSYWLIMPAASQQVEVLPGQAMVIRDLVTCYFTFEILPPAGGPKSYWLIVPAASQPVEVLPGQVMMIYPAVQPQLLFAAGASHAPVMTRLPSGAAFVTLWL